MLQARLRDSETAVEWARAEREEETAAAAKERKAHAARASEAETALNRLKVSRRP